jgi:hypothetical protein
MRDQRLKEPQARVIRRKRLQAPDVRFGLAKVILREIGFDTGHQVGDFRAVVGSRSDLRFAGRGCLVTAGHKTGTQHDGHGNYCDTRTRDECCSRCGTLRLLRARASSGGDFRDAFQRGERPRR